MLLGLLLGVIEPTTFTVSINHLESYDDILTVNSTLKEAGYALNSNGGEVKGDEEVKIRAIIDTCR